MIGWYETTVTKGHDIYETVVSVARLPAPDRQLLLTEAHPPKRFHWPGLNDRKRRRLGPIGPSCVCNLHLGRSNPGIGHAIVGQMGVVDSGCILYICGSSSDWRSESSMRFVLRSYRRESVHGLADPMSGGSYFPPKWLQISCIVLIYQIAIVKL